LIRLFGSLAVLALVNFFFMPVILAQNDFLREPPSGCGAFKPGLPGLAALYDALPLAFSPPFGFFPSLRCHAGVLAICNLLVFNKPWVEGFVSKVTLVLLYAHMA
jgi:hypothetical protein